MPTAGEFKHEPFGVPCQCFVKRRTRRINCMKACLRSDSSESSSSGHRPSDSKHKKVTFNPILSVRDYDDKIILDIDKNAHRWKCKHLEQDGVESRSSPPQHYAVTSTPVDVISLTIERPRNESAPKRVNGSAARNNVNITVACVNSTRRSDNISERPASFTFSPKMTYDRKLESKSRDRLDGSSLGIVEQLQPPRPNPVSDDSRSRDSEDSEISYSNCQESGSSDIYSRNSWKPRYAYFHKLVSSVRGLLADFKFIRKQYLSGWVLTSFLAYTSLVKMLFSQRILRVTSVVLFWTGSIILILITYSFFFVCSNMENYAKR